MGSSAEALEKNRHSKHPIKAISFGTEFLISKSSLYKSRLFMSVSFHRGTSVFLKPVLDIVQIAVLSPPLPLLSYECGVDAGVKCWFSGFLCKKPSPHNKTFKLRNEYALF
jgi:hypothetical protein